MLGNFSVGDYFKREAIDWAWEFVTQWLKLPPERLWITIFLDDEEAFKYWQEVGVPAERIVRFGEKDNFWGPAGDSGPCGPCSEIIYDFGKEFGCSKPDCGPGCDCPRFSEIWNLVFTQYNQDKEGRRTPLPKPNIDTGMGLERIAAVMQGKISVYETDLFAPIVARVAELAGKQYGQVDNPSWRRIRDEAVDRAINIVAEHARGIPFLIADGVVPSNEGRGYVLRRVLRRASLFGRKLGIEKPFLAEVATAVIAEMGALYPELRTNQDFVLSVISSEEERFGQTLDTGLNWLDKIVERAEKEGKEGERIISGEEVFMLYDTYGFPKELTAEISAEHGFSVDLEGFEQEMERQRERARVARKFTEKVTDGFKLKDEASVVLIPRSTKFVGYDSVKYRSTIAVLLRDSESVEEGQVDSVSKGEDVEVILRETPFYGEMGGQVGDKGEIRSSKGKVAVLNTIRLGEHIVHQGRVTEGSLSVNDSVEAEVDMPRRLDIARNHTATHLLQAALRAVLGEHVRQSGSLVAPERLRFDFTHLGSVTKEQLAEIQRIVNEKIRQDLPVATKTMAYTEAVSQGAIALFEEKYGETVRVLKIGDPPFSMEVCGGTHVKSTGEIGFFYITSEGSTGGGMRRIEAVTGRGAESFLEQRLSVLETMAQELQTSPEEVQSRLSATLAELDKERKRALAFERKLAMREAEDLRVKTVEGINLVSGKVSVESPEAMRAMGDRLKERLGSGVIVLGAIYNDRPNFMAMVTPDLVAKGFHAGEMVKQIAKIAGGGGGGRAELGQGSGKDVTKLDEALKQTGRYIKMHYDKDSGTWRTRVD
jgi:alanyl-tRNA synthetase